MSVHNTENAMARSDIPFPALNDDLDKAKVDMWELLPHHPAGVSDLIDFIVQDLGDGQSRFSCGAAWFDAARDKLNERLIERLRRKPATAPPAELLFSDYEDFVKEVAARGSRLAKAYRFARLVRVSRQPSAEFTQNTTSTNPANFLGPMVEDVLWRKHFHLTQHVREQGVFGWIRKQHRLRRTRAIKKARPPEHFEHAQVLLIDNLIYVVAVSGHVIISLDHAAYSETLDAKASDQALGKAVKAALQASRYLDPHTTPPRTLNLHFNVEAPARSKAWEKMAMKTAKIRSTRAFYRQARMCRIDRSNDTYKLIPSLDAVFEHKRKDAMAEVSQSIPHSASEKEIGAAVLSVLHAAS